MPLKVTEKVSITKDIFSIAAAVCIGIWVILSLMILQKKSIADLQVIELTQKTALTPQLQSTMVVKSYPYPDGGHVVQVGVTISNNGNVFSRLELGLKSISIANVKFKDSLPQLSNNIFFGDEVISDPTKVILPYLDVGPNEKYTMNYVTKVENPGLYMIRFLSENKDDSTKNHKIKTNTPVHVEYAVGNNEFISIYKSP